ncbi:MAG: TVP38/TMEM64 family protein, partial [Rhodospirillales bacterium]
MTGSDTANDAGKHRASPPLRALLVVAFVAAVAAVFAFDLDDYLTFEMLKSHRQGILEWYADNRVLAVVAFIAGYALTVALSVPGAVWLTLAGGFVFGTVAGTVVVVVAATLGALGLFLIARYVLADFFHEKA